MQEDFDEIRPKITEHNLDIENIDKSRITPDGYCDMLRVNIIPEKNEKLLFKFVFCDLTGLLTSDVIWPQPINLYLIVDDSEGDREYYLGASVKIKDFDRKEDIEEAITDIHLNSNEKNIIKFTLT